MVVVSESKAKLVAFAESLNPTPDITLMLFSPKLAWVREVMSGGMETVREV